MDIYFNGMFLQADGFVFQADKKKFKDEVDARLRDLLGMIQHTYGAQITTCETHFCAP